MLWMDGKGSDGQGPCSSDSAAACSESVKFYGFSISEGSDAASTPVAPLPAPAPQPAPSPVAPLPAPIPSLLPVSAPTVCSSVDVDCSETRCCKDSGMQCYAKNPWWAVCKETCTPGVDMTEEKKYQTPWSCDPLGSKAGEVSAAGEADKELEVLIRVKASEWTYGWGAGTPVTVKVKTSDHALEGEVVGSPTPVVVDETSKQERHGEAAGVPTSGDGMSSFVTTLGSALTTLLSVLLVAGAVAVLAKVWWRWTSSSKAPRRMARQLQADTPCSGTLRRCEAATLPPRAFAEASPSSSALLPAAAGRTM
mmetsp:Transcript_44968/g.95885  ORF Transcript_44968/g.95885 Transcript_44968/m.95885 type:complete len:309 (+) Transcript_44968:1-927(+)